MTIDEMKEAFTSTMQAYLSALDRYTDEQFVAKPHELEWSLGQMYEHLYGANTYFFLANMKRCLEQRKGQEGGEMNATGQNIFKHNSFPPIKVKVPDAVRGPEPEAKSKEAYKALFEETLHNGLILADAAANDPGTYKTYHPVFGWMNALQWFQGTETHARHHFRQQKEREEWLGIARV
jgi:hypothetical protein